MTFKPTPRPPARLSICLAAEANTGVIFRRGPTDWVRLIRWNTLTDEFEPGQWLHGKVEHYTLSPSAQFLLCSVHHFSREPYDWVTLSRPPYFSALALWPGSAYATFIDEKTIYIHDPAIKLGEGYELRKHKVVYGEASWNVVPTFPRHSSDVTPIQLRRKDDNYFLSNGAKELQLPSMVLNSCQPISLDLRSKVQEVQNPCDLGRIESEVRIIFVCIVVLLLTNSAKANETLTRAEAAPSGLVCLGAEVPVSMDTPAIFMRLDNSKKRFVSDKVGKILFANVDKTKAHLIRVSEDRRPPVEVLLDFHKLKTSRAIIWKGNGVWKIGPAEHQTCGSIQ